MPCEHENIIVKYTSEKEAIAWDTLNAQAHDKQEPTKYLKKLGLEDHQPGISTQEAKTDRVSSHFSTSTQLRQR